MSIVVVEKLFIATAILVEDTTDHEFNNRFDATWTYPTEAKNRLVIWIATHVPPVLAASYLQARCGDNETDFASAGQRTLRALSLVPFAPLELLTAMQHADFREVWRIAHKSPIDYSPNLTAFRHFLGEAEKVAGQLGGQCCLIHDEQAEFSGEFRTMADIVDALARAPNRRPNGVAPLACWFSSLEFMASVDEIGLQIADCVAASARHCLGVPHPDIQAAVQLLSAKCGYGVFPYALGTRHWMIRSLEALILLPQKFGPVSWVLR